MKNKIFNTLIKLSLIAGLFTMACSNPKYIRGTTVISNSSNKKIIAIMEKYRHAMINKDIPKLLTLIHPDYYQSRNTINTKPYNYDGLKKLMVKRFKQVKSIRMEMQYRKVTWNSNKTVDVEFYMDASFLLSVAGGPEEWKKKADYMMITLKKRDDDYLIVSGL